MNQERLNSADDRWNHPTSRSNRPTNPNGRSKVRDKNKSRSDQPNGRYRSLKSNSSTRIESRSSENPTIHNRPAVINPPSFKATGDYQQTGPEIQQGDSGTIAGMKAVTSVANNAIGADVSKTKAKLEAQSSVATAALSSMAAVSTASIDAMTSMTNLNKQVALDFSSDSNFLKSTVVQGNIVNDLLSFKRRSI